jgi:predicted DsbA family dithiol-disulfide isomerase
MKVEIWSDVMCPFCYIGKRRFEQALQGFGYQSDVQIEWKSFQLNPAMVTEPGVHIDEYLAKAKGISLERAKEMNEYVTKMAAEAGLTYNFDKAIVANSFRAHRYSHLAKAHGLGIEAEEQLFKAYFTDGKNTDDVDTLVELGKELGLDAEEVKLALEGSAYADEVKRDIDEAQYLGVQGVPFFVFNRKYAISGAQAVPVFEQTLNKAYTEWRAENPAPNFELIDGESCGPDGNC